MAGLLRHALLDAADDRLRLLLAAVDEEPAGALGDSSPHDEDREAEHCAEPEGDAPADVDGEVVLVQEDDRGPGSRYSAEPVRAVDDQVDAPADTRRDQLVDGGVDRGVLASDARSGEKSREIEVPRCEGERGRHGGRDVDGKRDQEELLPPEAIRELPEEERAHAGAGDVDGRRNADLPRRQLETASLLGEPLGECADDGHLEPVEDPHRPEADDDEPVEARPR